jgi:hypothetical protein
LLVISCLACMVRLLNKRSLETGVQAQCVIVA